MAQHKRFQKIYIEITNRCNLNCSFCPVTNRPARMLSPDEFDHITDAILPLTDHICLHVKGEPLMHPNLKDILTIASKKGLFVNLTTNGTLLPQKGALLMNAHAPRQVSLSLHSFDASTLHISDFESYVRAAIDFAKSFTAATPGYISFRLWNLTPDADEDQRQRNQHILTALEDAYQLSEPVISRPGRAHGNTLAPRTYLNFDHLFAWPDMAAEDFGCTGTCYGLRRQLAILADGTVVPCCLDNEGLLPLGNIFTESPDIILAKEKSLRIIEGFQNRKITEPLCRHCGYRTRF